MTDLNDVHICMNCHEICTVIVHEWKEREEFWGAPCWRTEYEDRSECCDDEVATASECQLNGWPVGLESAKELGWDK